MRHPHDRNLHVEFYMNAVQDMPKSELAGHPVFIDVPFIKIHIPGDGHNIVDTKVNDYYANRFKDEFDNFMSGKSQGVSGWLLREWPAVNVSQVKTLEYLNIHTVEQLAGLSDTQLQKIGMGGMELRAKAKAALDAAAGGAAGEAQAAENARLRQEMEEMKAQIAAMARGPGRPRKEQAEA